MADERLVPSLEEEEKRENVIRKLKEAHDSDSDIDALCIGPRFASMAEDFFIVLHNMLKSRDDISEIHSVKYARVPLMRFKFYGILIDLPYTRLNVSSVPENVDILNISFFNDVDETTVKSLSGVRVSKCILQLVPNLEKFQSMLWCVKFWAKRRGVYGNLEEVQGLCNPNPTEYVDVDAEEPNAVFYWGLQPGKTNVPHIESVGEAFWSYVCNGYQGSLGRLDLSVVQAFQLPKHGGKPDNAGNKGTKAYWRLLDYNQQRIPIYSQHLPSYVV